MANNFNVSGLIDFHSYVDNVLDPMGSYSLLAGCKLITFKQGILFSVILCLGLILFGHFIEITINRFLSVVI